MPETDDEVFVLRDIVDGQLVTGDGHLAGRVDDVVAELRADGALVLTHLVTGPQALAGRVSSRLRPAARFLLRDRFDHVIPLDEVEDVGPTIRLRGAAASYPTGRSERWVADHVLRFIPGCGRR